MAVNLEIDEKSAGVPSFSKSWYFHLVDGFAILANPIPKGWQHVVMKIISHSSPFN